MELIKQYQELSILYLEIGMINTAEYYNKLAIKLTNGICKDYQTIK